MPARAGSLNAWVIEITERLEAETLSGKKDVLNSTGGTHTAFDLAAVLSFVLNLTFTISEHSLRNLTSPKPTNGLGLPSNKLLSPTFDANVIVTDTDVENIISFTRKMWHLKRTEFKAIMSGIRRYVVATHMIIDEPSLAYILLVMAIEAIEQNTSEVKVDWEDIGERKRRKIDAALEGSDKELAATVKNAVCETEKTNATGKFRHSILSNIAPSYFRTEAKSANRPPSSSDLKQMLQSAYQARSSYVHRLEELDNNFLSNNDYAETVWVAGKTHLSHQGLARLVRHVIQQRVLTAKEYPEEQYNYRPDLPGLSVMPWASEYSIGSAQDYGTSISKRYLAECLEQLFQSNIDTSADITSQADVMQKIEELLQKQQKIDIQAPLVAHYFAYNCSVSENDRSSKLEETDRLLEDRYGDEHFYTFEFFAVNTILQWDLDYSFDQAETYWQKYEGQRHHKNGLKLSHRIEAAMLLNVAELAHSNGIIGEAISYVSKAVEALPGQKFLLFLETEIDRFVKGGANWRDCFIESQRIR